MNTTETNRHEFEERFSHFDLSRNPLNGIYLDYGSEGAWQGWQAAREQVTEQRDEALSDLEFRRDLYRLQTKTLEDVREQRDRLAEALEKAKPIVSRYPSGWDFSHDELDAADKEIDEALKSLTTNEL
jgi:hypothetical protein